MKTTINSEHFENRVFSQLTYDEGTAISVAPILLRSRLIELLSPLISKESRFTLTYREPVAFTFFGFKREFLKESLSMTGDLPEGTGAAVLELIHQVEGLSYFELILTPHRANESASNPSFLLV